MGRIISFRAFTLVELIVVITIVATLSVIGYVSYTGYIIGSRDTKRIATMTKTVETLQQYASSKNLPLPDNSVTITSSGITVGYQGKLGQDALETLGMDENIRDPKDDTYYSYFLGSNRKTFQFVALMERQENQIALDFYSHANANNEDRYPRIFGTPLGIMLETGTNIPLEDLSIASNTLDIQDIGVIFELSSYLSGEEKVTGTGSQFATLVDLTPRNGKGWRVVNNQFECFDINNDGRCPVQDLTYTPFVSVWNFPSENYNFEFPVATGQGLEYDFVINWGDGSEESEITSETDPDLNHVYVNSGEYTITAIGQIEGFQNSIDGPSRCVEGTHSDKLLRIVDMGNTGWKNLSKAFCENENLTNIENPGDTSQVTTMRQMFLGVSNMISVPLFDTSNVTDMSEMFFNFFGPSSLTSIPLFDTSNVTDMGAMFGGQTSITTIPLFDTSNVTDMSEMFFYTSSLDIIPLLDTSNVTNMVSMFHYSSISTIPPFNTSNVTNMRSMFNRAINLTTIPPFNTSSVTDMGSMFDVAVNLTTIPLLDTSNVTDMNRMFNAAFNFNNDLSGWNVNQVTDCSLFSNNTSNWNLPKPSFTNCAP